MSYQPLDIFAWPGALLLAMVCGQSVDALDTPPGVDVPALAKHVNDIAEAVLKHHVDPPAKQQMVLAGIRAVYKAALVPEPPGLARRISGLSTGEQFAAWIEEVWPKSAGKDAKLDEAIVQAVLQSIPGGASLVTAKEHKVNEQLGGNRYVGLHIAIELNEKEHRPAIREAFEGGPADRAGVKQGDVIEEIDGFDTKGLAITGAIDRLRGEEGTEVVIRVRQPGAAEARTLRITRGRLAHPTIMGFRKRVSNDWDLRIDGAEPIAYLRIEEVLASTPHELRQMASKLESDGAKALVLDLRWLHRAELHPTVLLADSLLDGGIIGRVRTADGIVTYRAEPDALIPSMPLVVMTSPETAGPGVWLAAALADNRHAKIAATSRMAPRRAANDFRNASRVNASVPVGDGAWWITLTTGVLELADGRPLALGASPGDLQAVASIEEPATLKSPQDANLHILQTVPLRDLSKPGAGAADIVPARTETEKLREQLNAIVEQSNEYKRAETKLNEQIRALERELNAPSGRPGSTNGKTQGPAGPPQMHTPPVDADGEWILSRDHPLQQAVQVLKQALRSP